LSASVYVPCCMGALEKIYFLNYTNDQILFYLYYIISYFLGL